MTNGSSQGLLVIVAVIIFSIFIVVSYFVFRDTMRSSLSEIFEDGFLLANRGLGIDNSESKESETFLKSSKFDITTQAHLYMGSYIDWKYDSDGYVDRNAPEIKYTKAVSSGDTYTIIREVDMSKYIVRKGTTIEEGVGWAGLTTMSTIYLKISDEDRDLIDLENNRDMYEESNGIFKLYETGNSINLTPENREENQEYSINMKDGSTKKIIIKWKAVNNPNYEGELAKNYNFDFTYNFRIYDYNSGKTKNVFIDFKGKMNDRANIVVDSGGFVNSGIENYALLLTSIDMSLNNSNDYFIFELNDASIPYKDDNNYKLMDYETNLGISQDDFTENTIQPMRNVIFNHSFKVI